LWLPSQKGLLAECPHRHSEIAVRPAKPKTWPDGSEIWNSPSMRSGPLFRGVILVAIGWMVARRLSFLRPGRFVQLIEQVVEVDAPDQLRFDHAAGAFADALSIRLHYLAFVGIGDPDVRYAHG
jgi:hypothetical protein